MGSSKCSCRWYLDLPEELCGAEGVWLNVTDRRSLTEKEANVPLYPQLVQGAGALEVSVPKLSRCSVLPVQPHRDMELGLSAVAFLSQECQPASLLV